MIRTVLYPSKDAVTEPVLQAAIGASDQPPDDYRAKLVKYIPAEVIGFFIPAYALVSRNGSDTSASGSATAQIVVVVVSLVGLVGYLYVSSAKERPPRLFYYVLSILAFLAWAVGTSSVGQDVFHLPERLNEFTVLVAVFLIPMVDELLTRAFATRPKGK
jgi:hypothetical protein